ncbi:MAG TPA: response regulator [Vicinamibacterales bacterium]|nr:response regulator [Vicinamibacterales bacterium]
MADSTVLVIDDNVVLARAYARVLTDAGFRVHTWHSAEDGLRQAKNQPPDAIILDYQMPFMNGVGFLYRLRADSACRKIPVMIVTGVAMSDQQVSEFNELGATVRMKPLNVDQLLLETRALLADTAVDAHFAVPYVSR